MKNSLKIPPCRRIAEDDRAECLTVDVLRLIRLTPRVGEHAHSKPLDDLLADASVFQKFVPHCIGIDHHGPTLS